MAAGHVGLSKMSKNSRGTRILLTKSVDGPRMDWHEPVVGRISFWEDQ